MRLLAAHDDAEVVGARLHRSTTVLRESQRSRADVQGEDRIDHRSVEHTVADHRTGAAYGRTFLGRLEDELHRAL